MRPRTLSLTAVQRSELAQVRDRDRRAYLRECAAALLKIADGQSAHHVACHGLLKRRKPDTVYYYSRTSCDRLLLTERSLSRWLSLLLPLPLTPSML